MTEPKVKFKKLTIYYVAIDEDDQEIDHGLNWLVTQSDQIGLTVADYKIEDWRKDQTEPKALSEEYAREAVKGLKAILTLKEMAEFLNVTRQTIYRWRERGYFKMIRAEGTRMWLVEREEIERMLREGYGR
tara:strand:- start:2855 stop:3247 length:393 start_codon:yes stop_codon:yes gene_type:complete